MVPKKMAYSLITALVISSCSPNSEPIGDVAVSDFDNDGLADTLFAQYWVVETDIGIRYGKGIEQKIATLRGEKEVRFANVIGNNVYLGWHKEGEKYLNIDRLYNHGVSGDSVIFSFDRTSQ